jgi:hypothetical protein
MSGTLVPVGFLVWVFTQVVKLIQGQEGLVRQPSPRS